MATVASMYLHGDRYTCCVHFIRSMCVMCRGTNFNWSTPIRLLVTMVTETISMSAQQVLGRFVVKELCIMYMYQRSCMEGWKDGDDSVNVQ